MSWADANLRAIARHGHVMCLPDEMDMPAGSMSHAAARDEQGGQAIAGKHQHD